MPGPYPEVSEHNLQLARGVPGRRVVRPLHAAKWIFQIKNIIISESSVRKLNELISSSSYFLLGADTVITGPGYQYLVTPLHRPCHNFNIICTIAQPKLILFLNLGTLFII